MCDRVGNWLFEATELKNRLWESDKLSKKALLVLRSITFLILIEINILAVFVYSKVEPLKVFSITSISFIFSLVTYGFLLALRFIETKSEILWKIAHCMFEIFFSFSVGLTVVFWCVIIPVLFSRGDVSVAGLQNGWYEITIRFQLHTAVFVAYLVDLYTNRIEFPFRHFVVVFSCMLIFIAVYLGVSRLGEPIDDYVDWSDLRSIGFIVAVAALIIGTFYCAALASEKKKGRYLVTSQPKDKQKGNQGSSDRISFDSV